MKSIKRLKRLFSKCGFTLVETSMSMVLLLILIATASGIILTGGNIFARNTLHNAAEIIGNDTYRFVASKLSCASSLYSEDQKQVIGEMQAEPYYEQLCFEADGSSASLRRYTNGTETGNYEFCSEERLKGFRTTLAFEETQLAPDCYIMTLTVKIYDGEISQENLKYIKEGTIKLYNMKDDNLWWLNAKDNLSGNALYISYTYID